MPLFEHRQAIHDISADFPAWLDEQAAGGWELVAVNAVAAKRSVVMAGNGVDASMVWACVFRRERPDAPESRDS